MLKEPSKVALFGGTFDPVHFGHINLAIEMLEKQGLDKVMFCPASQNPLKHSTITPSEHRLEMLRLAILDIPQFEILNWELERPAPSYTIDTLEQLAKEYPKPFLILGEDSMDTFHEWKDWQKIEQLAKIVVGPRCGDAATKAMRIIEVSSTELRNRLQKGLYCGHLMPKIVLDYIYTHQLYLATNYG
jgi:nicotinate-nucleotide adenylyltransferase